MDIKVTLTVTVKVILIKEIKIGLFVTEVINLKGKRMHYITEYMFNM